MASPLFLVYGNAGVARDLQSRAVILEFLILCQVLRACGTHIFLFDAYFHGKDSLIVFLSESLFSSWRLGPFGICGFFGRVGAVKKRR